jgi:hypothetical protein
LDWLQDIVDEFRRDGLAESSVQEFMAFHEEIKEKYEREEASLNEAVKKIKDTVKQIRAELEKIKAKRYGKKEPKKIPHEKATPAQKLQRKEEQKPKLAIRIEVPDEARRERIAKTKYVGGYSVVNYFAEIEGTKLGIAITKDEIAGLVINTQGVDYELNTKLLVELIKGEI